MDLPKDNQRQRHENIGFLYLVAASFFVVGMAYYDDIAPIFINGIDTFWALPIGAAFFAIIGRRQYQKAKKIR